MHLPVNARECAAKRARRSNLVSNCGRESHVEIERQAGNKTTWPGHMRAANGLLLAIRTRATDAATLLKAAVALPATVATRFLDAMDSQRSKLTFARGTPSMSVVMVPRCCALTSLRAVHSNAARERCHSATPVCLVEMAAPSAPTMMLATHWSNVDHVEARGSPPIVPAVSIPANERICRPRSSRRNARKSSHN